MVKLGSASTLLYSFCLDLDCIGLVSYLFAGRVLASKTFLTLRIYAVCPLVDSIFIVKKKEGILGANPSFIRALMVRVDDDTNYEQQISFYKKSYPFRMQSTVLTTEYVCDTCCIRLVLGHESIGEVIDTPEDSGLEPECNSGLTGGHKDFECVKQT